MTRRDALLTLAIALAAVAVYHGVLDSGFVRFDDASYVSGNRMVWQGFTSESVRWAFTTFLNSNYHPLTWLSHMLDVELFGLDPSGHHATSLLLHVANSLLVFWLFRTATHEAVASAVVAGLFAIHPTHVESVAWVAERKDILSTFFGLLAMGVYVGAQGRPTRARLAGVTCLFGLSLLAKPMLVTLPAALLLLDFWPLRRLASARALGPLLVEKWPLLALSAAGCVITIAAQEHALAIRGDVTLGARVANAVVSYGRYLALTAWPAQLSVLYPHPSLGGVAPPLWQVTLLGVALALATLGVLLARSRPYLAFGWLWFGGTLVPVIGLVQVGFQAMADRYLYMPSLGLYVILAWGGGDLWRRLLPARPNLARTLALAAAAWGVALALLAVRQVAAWRDTETLFTRALAAAPGAFVLHRNLGNELLSLNRLDEAIAHFRQAVAIAPDYVAARHSLVGALRARGDFAEAAEQSIRARGLASDSAEAELERGDAARRLGDLASAHGHLRRAIERNPRNAEAFIAAAELASGLGESDDAIGLLRRAAALDPDSAVAHIELARALFQSGDAAGAVRALRDLVARHPDESGERSQLAHLLRITGDLDAAIAEYRIVADAQPDSAAAQRDLGDALLENGATAEAAVALRRALALEPNHPPTRELLDRALREAQ